MRVLVRNLAIISISALALSGCMSTYTVAGQFEGSGQAFFGTVTVGMGQSGALDVSSADGRVKCTGASQVMKIPSGFSLVGGQGAATATCTDGRTFKVDFVQTSESGGHGQGIDDRGSVVQIYFDTSDGLARSQLDQHRINTLIQ